MNENRYYQQLTKEALSLMLNFTKINYPIVQLLLAKKMHMANDIRYRVKLSDGVHSYSCCIIIEPFVTKIEENEFDLYCLLKINRFSLTLSRDHWIIVLHDLQLVAKGSEVGGLLGSPVEFERDRIPPLSNFRPNYHFDTQNDQMDVDLESISLDHVDWPLDRLAELQPQTSNTARSINFDLIRPINQLNPYMKKWCIKGRCTSKTNKRSWKNERGEGTLFTFTLADRDCDIDLTAFRLECEKFFESIIVDEIFFVSGGLIKSKREGSKTKAEYAISLNADTLIERCDDESEFAPIAYNFKKIDQVEEGFFDVVAIIQHVGDAETVMRRDTDEPLIKRELNIVDDTEKEISLTIWGQKATDFAGKEGDAIAGRRLRISYFKGPCLTTTLNSQIKVNPNSVRARNLREWYAHVKNTLRTTSPSKEVGAFRGRWGILSAINLKNIKNLTTFQVKAVIYQMGKTILYKGCRICNKKMVQDADGLYICEKCPIQRDDFRYRIILSFFISDHTKRIWVQTFHENSLKLLSGATDLPTNLEELNDLFQNKPSEFENRIRSCHHRSFIFKLSSKVEKYNNEMRIRTQVINLHEIDHLEYGKILLQQIRNN